MTQTAPAASVPRRRRLRFNSYEEVLADVRSLVSGPTRHLGNWTLPDICQHLATAIESSIDGEKGFALPLTTRIFARLFRNRILNSRLPTGVKLPPDAEAVLFRAGEHRSGDPKLGKRLRPAEIDLAASGASGVWQHDASPVGTFSLKARRIALEPHRAGVGGSVAAGCGFSGVSGSLRPAATCPPGDFTRFLHYADKRVTRLLRSTSRIRRVV